MIKIYLVVIKSHVLNKKHEIIGIETRKVPFLDKPSKDVLTSVIDFYIHLYKNRHVGKFINQPMKISGGFIETENKFSKIFKPDVIWGKNI